MLYVLLNSRVYDNKTCFCILLFEQFCNTSCHWKSYIAYLSMFNLENICQLITKNEVIYDQLYKTYSSLLNFFTFCFTNFDFIWILQWCTIIIKYYLSGRKKKASFTKGKSDYYVVHILILSQFYLIIWSINLNVYIVIFLSLSGGIFMLFRVQIWTKVKIMGKTTDFFTHSSFRLSEIAIVYANMQSW